MATIECKTNYTSAHIHKRAYQASVSCNIFGVETKVLRPWGRALIKLDLSLAISEGYYGRIVGRFVLATCVVLLFTMERFIWIVEVLCEWYYPIFLTRNKQ